MGKTFTPDRNYQEMEGGIANMQEEALIEQEWVEWMEKLSRLLVPVREDFVRRLLLNLQDIS